MSAPFVIKNGGVLSLPTTIRAVDAAHNTAEQQDATEQALGLYAAQADAIRELLDKHAPHTTGNLLARIAQVLGDRTARNSAKDADGVDQLFGLAGRIRDLPDGVVPPSPERDQFLHGFAQGHRAARIQAAGIVEDASRGEFIAPLQTAGKNVKESGNG